MPESSSERISGGVRPLWEALLFRDTYRGETACSGGFREEQTVASVLVGEVWECTFSFSLTPPEKAQKASREQKPKKLVSPEPSP